MSDAVSDEDLSDEAISGDDGDPGSCSEESEPSDTPEDLSVSEDGEGTITARSARKQASCRKASKPSKPSKPSKASRSKPKEKVGSESGQRVATTQSRWKRARVQSFGSLEASKEKLPKLRIGRGVSHKAGFALLSESEDGSDMESEGHAKDFRHLKLKEDYQQRCVIC